AGSDTQRNGIGIVDFEIAADGAGSIADRGLARVTVGRGQNNRAVVLYVDAAVRAGYWRQYVEGCPGWSVRGPAIQCRGNFQSDTSRQKSGVGIATSAIVDDDAAIQQQIADRDRAVTFHAQCAGADVGGYEGG